MISVVDLFGFISIVFAVNVIRIAIKDQKDTEKTPYCTLFQSEKETESFVDIPMEFLEKALQKDTNVNLDEQKHKIEKFKERNRFYNL